MLLLHAPIWNRYGTVKRQNAALMFLGLALGAAPVFSLGQTNDLHQRALEVLRRAMVEQPGATDAAKRNSRPAPGIKEPDFTEIEKQYLDGKISAKQFQKYLQDHKVAPAKAPVATSPDNTTRPVERLRQETAKSKAADPVAVAKTNTIAPPAAVQTTAAKVQAPPASPPAAVPAPTVGKADPAGKSALSEVEAKMEELLQLKAAREKAALTNAMAATNGAAKPTALTKRQRLDEVLKLYVEGKIPETEYRARRAKILAEPE
jgi:hypothetical protein